ncbi:MAG: RNA 2',3'-cyclic phosphodiesterase [Candidatus Anoxychlamydiales bacterium]|nr:RNA 2',3'-cyclic phosphodiesterase [Candidatus Anoxychlamydiales bacterium]
MEKDTKRLFFGFEIQTLWPKTFTAKKIIKEENRHITLLFLGENIIEDIEKHLQDLPSLDTNIPLAGFFDKTLFLPEKNPRLVAYRANFFDKSKEVKNFQNELFEFFKKKNFSIKQNSNFLPHVTVCRENFSIKEFKENFYFFPFYIKSFNLYESFQNSEYKTLWKKDFQKPFQEFFHTADIAFIIKGENFSSLLLNSFIALAFKEFSILNYFNELKSVTSLDDVIINLNEIITKAEIDGLHMPFKAVSFHSDIETKQNLLHWEMIVDV